MGELRGGRPDQPLEKPDAPEPSGDLPHASPTGDNNDPRAIRRTMHASDAFAPPGKNVEVRYVTGPRTDTGPDATRPYRTSLDRPAPDPKPDAPDGPTHRAPDIDPPSGEELLEKDAPGAQRLDRARKKFFEAENLDNEQSTIHDWGDLFQGTILEKPQSPPAAKCEVRPPDSISGTPHHGIETGDTLTSMFFAGILLGEGARMAYRKASEVKERAHARNG